MGVVYLATDTRLDRPVAIKFLPEHSTDNAQMRHRFKNEAKAAAALNHPNIATIHSIEEIQKDLFIVMEYIEGRELKDIILTLQSSSSSDSLQKFDALQRESTSEIISPLNIFLNYAVQIAEGLLAAHEKGIIHRDIKSSNIMLTQSNTIKIMDFGLARISSDASLTDPGERVGTIAYMSPEQINGETIDVRSDIWSFGVVLYELLTGQLPFQGQYTQAIIYGILMEDPEKVELLLPDVPSNVASIVLRMLEKNPDDRFQSMLDVISALQNTKQSISPAPFRKETKSSSVAVIPFTDMSFEKNQAYFCEGIAEEILNNLNKIKGLQVSSRTSSFQFRKKNIDIREIGNKLNVGAILEGSVRKSGERLRINVQLINVSDGFHLWAERYDRQLEDVFAIQDDIAGQVATALKGILTKNELKQIHSEETVVAAYEFFLKGRNLLQQTSGDEAQKMFEKSIQSDSTYAPAYAGLAEVYSWKYEWYGAHHSDLLAADKYSQKALELGPHLAESHTSRGYVLTLQENFKEAEKEYESAIQMNPNGFEAYYFYARSCFARGDMQKAAELFVKASEVRRDDFQSMSLLWLSSTILGKKEQAEKALRESIHRAERLLELDPSNKRVLSLGAVSQYKFGQTTKSFEWIEKALHLYPDDRGVLFNGTCLMAIAGRKDEAISLFERAIANGFGNKAWIEKDPDYDSLRDDPRFQRLVEQL
ncbi:MAG: protein kinase [Candidatus Marinimicrobia bacterium]|nr:protein kinase [Candidatus Neomarinimicrobiota bacterium]